MSFWIFSTAPHDISGFMTFHIDFPEISYSLLYWIAVSTGFLFYLSHFFRLADVAELSIPREIELWKRDDGDNVLKCNRKPVKITMLWRWQVRILWWHIQNINTFLGLRFQYYVKPTTVLMFSPYKYVLLCSLNKNVLGDISPWFCFPLHLAWMTFVPS